MTSLVFLGEITRSSASSFAYSYPFLILRSVVCRLSSVVRHIRARQIYMPFGRHTCAVQRHFVSHGVLDPQGKGIFGGQTLNQNTQLGE